MKPEGLSEFVKKVLADEKTRQQFESDPQSVLSNFSLTEEETRAVMSRQHKLGVAGAGSQELDGPIVPAGYWF